MQSASAPILNAAQQRMVVENIGLVRKVLKGFMGRGVDAEDLHQEGLTGLTIAVHRYDPSRGVTLATYATYWIRARMMEFIVRTRGPVRIGTTRTQRKIFFGLARARHALECNGQPASTEALAAKLGVDVADLESMAPRLRQSDVSLDSPRPDDDGVPFGDRIASDGPSPEDECIAHERSHRRRARLAQLLAHCTLSQREKEILAARHMSEQPQTLEQLSGRLGVCRERVRQIEEKALERLRQGAQQMKGWALRPAPEVIFVTQDEPETDPDSRRRRCSKCRGIGHNARSCKSGRMKALPAAAPAPRLLAPPPTAKEQKRAEHAERRESEPVTLAQGEDVLERLMSPGARPVTPTKAEAAAATAIIADKLRAATESVTSWFDSIPEADAEDGINTSPHGATPPSRGPVGSTARGGQLTDAGPVVVPAPVTPPAQHVEVYVGPPRAPRIEKLETAHDAAIEALQEAVKDSNWACVRVALRILHAAGGTP